MCGCLTLCKVTLTHCSGKCFPLCFYLFFCVLLFSSAAAERAASLPELTPAQRNKLRHLSIISLASNLKVQVHYSLIQVLHKSADELWCCIDFCFLCLNLRK